MPAEALARMNSDAMVFAMANPNPEVNPEEAAPYVRIMATGRSDYPNQINNVLCFPGIFRGALDVRAPAITEDMKMAAARAIAAIVDDDELREDYIIPSVFNRDVAPAVAAAVAEQARAAGHRASRPGGRLRPGRHRGGRPHRDRHAAPGGRPLRRRVREAAMPARDGDGSDGTDRSPRWSPRCSARAGEVTVLSREPERARRALGERGGPRAGTRSRSPPRRRRWPGATRSCTWPASRSPSAGAPAPSGRSATAA